jgi:hypothetical protein
VVAAGVAVLALAGRTGHRTIPLPSPDPLTDAEADILPAGADDVENVFACQPQDVPADEQADESRRHFNLGLAAFNAHHYPDAKRELQLSYCLFPNPTALFDIAASFERMEMYDEAAAAYLGYIANSGPFEPTTALVLKRIGVELTHVAKVTVAAEPPDAAFTLSGARGTYRGVAGTPVAVPGGRFQVIVSKEGYRPAVQSVFVRTGATPTLRYVLKPR